MCRAFRGYIRFVELGVVENASHVCNGTFGADFVNLIRVVELGIVKNASHFFNGMFGADFVDL